MPARGSRAIAADITVEEENDKNIPPQGRRSQRAKGRKSAPVLELGTSTLNIPTHTTSAW